MPLFDIYPQQTLALKSQNGESEFFWRLGIDFGKFLTYTLDNGDIVFCLKIATISIIYIASTNKIPYLER